MKERLNWEKNIHRTIHERGGWMKANHILVVNLGSTSSKIAVFYGDMRTFDSSFDHSLEDIKKYPGIDGQYSMRKLLIEKTLADNGFTFYDFDAIAVRGLGAPRRYHGGAYIVDDVVAREARQGFHIGMALGAIIANDWSKQYNIPAYLYDVVYTDEFQDIARISGCPLIERSGAVHTLNARAVARQVAAEQGKEYKDVTYIVCHLGGGISTSLHFQGRIIDGFATDEGTFTPDRTGKLPLKKFHELCTGGKYGEQEINKLIQGNGGLIGYLGINDCREIETRINDGDEKALLVYRAMAYQVAQDIGAMATAAKGNLDAIILTGGIAFSEMFTNWVVEYISFLAPIIVFPGSMEMQALARGVNRVLNNEEMAYQYVLGETVL